MFKEAVFTLALITGSVWFMQSQPKTTVLHVHDGDSFTVEVSDNGKYTKFNVRMAGIDAKELRQKGQDGIDADKARKTLMYRLVGKEVELVNCTMDKYQRQACEVYQQGQNINSYMVFTGNAFDYPAYSKGKYATDEQIARTFKRGVWNKQKDGGERPDVFRRRTKSNMQKVHLTKK